MKLGQTFAPSISVQVAHSFSKTGLFVKQWRTAKISYPV